MDWRFSSFQKIARNTDRWDVTDQDFRQFDKMTWVVTEKIHGAHFAFITDGKTIRCAKRKRLLDDQEAFFGFQNVRDQLQNAVLESFQAFSGSMSDLVRLTIFGELFGGGYPHPDVPKVPDVEPIQTGIWYTPNIEFLAFDLLAQCKTKSDPIFTYIDFDVARDRLLSAGVPCVEPLFEGAYAEALTFPIHFNSTIPARLGLPELEDPNPAEGVVIKPVKTLFVSSAKGEVRPILKRKIPQFEEERFHQATKWSKKTDAGYGMDLLEWEMLALINENRINSARSKLGGEVDLLQEVVRDVWEDLEERHQAHVEALSTEERVLLESLLTDEVKKHVKVGGSR